MMEPPNTRVNCRVLRCATLASSSMMGCSRPPRSPLRECTSHEPPLERNVSRRRLASSRLCSAPILPLRPGDTFSVAGDTDRYLLNAAAMLKEGLDLLADAHMGFWAALGYVWDMLASRL